MVTTYKKKILEPVLKTKKRSSSDSPVNSFINGNIYTILTFEYQNYLMCLIQIIIFYFIQSNLAYATKTRIVLDGQNNKKSVTKFIISVHQMIFQKKITTHNHTFQRDWYIQKDKSTRHKCVVCINYQNTMTITTNKPSTTAYCWTIFQSTTGINCCTATYQRSVQIIVL